MLRKLYFLVERNIPSGSKRIQTDNNLFFINEQFAFVSIFPYSLLDLSIEMDNNQ